ncbi:hypothetical protein KTD17_18995 [Burkholderia multivorans]|uniref:hypothetical protein n=1 Tax=Burkholderia multivorans TaxID=87883 RepID=UPI001C231188|nr:hypothetical protein [Burkholderia multivorans]MBU9135091.1 hypothetical protein [Burkholderia multivorans]MBU9453546.1 hypothetical protein [Burkholderia multivorans]
MQSRISRSAAQLADPAAKMAQQWKKPAQGGLLHFLAERTGLAYILQAAHARARASLRVPPKPRRRLPPLRSHAPASGLNGKRKMKKPAQGGLLHFLAERTGLAYILQAADARARASLRVPPEAAQAASSAP